MDVLSIILLLVVGYLAYKMFAPTKGVKQVSTTELKPLLNDRKRFYLDVRTPAEFKGNHIKGFKNIPLQTLNSQLNQIPKDKEVLVICQSGMRSKQAVKVLKKAGYSNVTEVRGGMNAWR
ncbi:rhodanese-like domain-containing protein [Exiguobacterium indicum]|uniref:Rhodanese-like domain-containing protein n=1 Tax=Exiguobacterium indicum TaxID=296995 RepID=A0ABU8EJU8_9BACL|nr:MULTISPECIES: rhodanese-like domain-containing protein [Exiguobacterium]MBF8153954.1 rhodanese-like domain-containing protein [Exiguobacterium sp. TBG-PICH-001]QZY87171.1 rhodanese-like domain-containing protein [Exiguobacterium acetylicum]